MTETVWQSIASTPWWVYLFCIYLFWICYSATKPRFASIKQLTTMPFFFVALSVMSMCAMMQAITAIHLSLWIGTLLLGTGLGYLHLRFYNIKAVKSTDSIYFPGTWMPMIILSAILITQCYFGYHLTFDPQIFLNPDHSMLIVFIYGLLTGLFLGRLAYALRCMKVLSSKS